MIRKILKKDLYRNKVITLSLFVFILLSAVLTASSASVFVKLSSSIDSFFLATAAPDFVQMHAGEFDHEIINDFAKEHNDIINDHQIVTLLNVKGSSLFFNQKEHSEEGSVMDAAFVVQNKRFDYLINEDDQVLQLTKGEVAVPVYYQQRDQLKKGDHLYVMKDGVLKDFVIADFIRDVQMNASIISSKRILMNEKDYDDMKAIASSEYLIEFKSEDSGAVEIAYQNSSLPHNGTAITHGLLYTLNALMDGILAAVLLAVALLLMGIAFLCLRFTILMTLEEDVKEIGVMKAIGISKKDIQRLYMGKYMALTLVGCIGGAILSFLLQSVIFQNIQLYMGSGPTTAGQYLFPLLAVFLLGLLILGFCKLMLGKMHRITALQALRSDVISNMQKTTGFCSLRTHGSMPVSLLISIQDLWVRKRLYLSVFFVVLFSSFLLIVPQNLQSTMNSRSFIRYMGIGNSDLRMDITQEGFDTRKVETSLAKDKDVTKYAVYGTYKTEMKNAEGEWVDLQVETGDFSLFPLTYLEGQAPKEASQIAVSYAAAQEQGWNVKDTVELQIGNELVNTKICGIYQDITNGGKSAKMSRELSKNMPLRSTINVNFKEGSDLSEKVKQYTTAFAGIKATDTQGYVNQTLSGLNGQIRLVAKGALILAIIITFFQMTLFLKMLLKKDEQETTIMKCIGFTTQQLQCQYLLRMLITSCLGIIAGTLLANIGGEALVSLCMQGMGVAHLDFVIQPWMTCLILPLIILCSAGIATILATRKIGNLHIADLNIE